MIRLKIQIRDKDGVEPAYPVLVHLATGGPHHGTLILDPDGTRTECPDASFLWHERDAQGNLVALNEELEYRMGTWSRYVGVEPDPDNPPQVRPVWGVAEDLGIRLETPDGAPLSYRVHPEPGKPDHFASFDFQGRPEDNRFEYWSDYLVNPVGGGGPITADRHTTWNVYALVDAFGNTTYGYGVTSSTSSRPNVTVEFENQLADGPDFAAYTMTTWWNDAGGMPEGDVPASLSVTYPSDPDWGGGNVTQPITLVFQRGTFHAVMFYPNYDHHALIGGGAYGPWDEPVPLSVGPGDSEGVLPKTTAGDTPRFTLLLVTGTNIPNPMGAPWPDPHNLNWSCGGGVCTHEVGTGYDPRLEATDPGEFRLSLMDGTGNVAKDAQFRVHLCPRYDHEGPVPPVEGYSRTCTMAPQVSENGVIESVIPNPQGSTDGRGYIGIELIKAPVNPGSYLIYLESKDKTYRIREQSQWFRDFSPDGVYSGGWWLCTVAGGEILDENFQRLEELRVDQPTQAYVRLINPSEDSGTIDLTVSTWDSKHRPLSTDIAVTAARLATSHIFIAPIVFAPQGYTEGASSASMRMEAASGPQGPTVLAESVRSVAEVFSGLRRWAEKILHVRPLLEIEWLDEQAQPFAQGVMPKQVTRIDRSPDAEEEGRFLYSEKTWVRIAAKTRLGLPVEDAKGSVRLDEGANDAFPSDTFFATTTDWQYSYQGEFGKATNLRTDRSSTDPTLTIPLNNGLTDPIALVSLAGPRAKAGSSFFEATWDATLRACDAQLGAPCGVLPGPEFAPGHDAKVTQWVDQQVYGRHVAGAQFNRWANGDPNEPGNAIPDWLEAMVWDTLSNHDAPAYPAAVQEAVRTPKTLWAPTSTNPRNQAEVYAEFTPPDARSDDCPHDDAFWVMTFYPNTLDEDAFRWDKAYVRYLWGIRVAQAHALTDVVLHEARHGWQRWITECGGPLHETRTPDDQTDRDDLLSDPVAATGDPFTARIRDAASAEIVGATGNPEVHLFGPSTSDAPGNSWDLVVERDAECFPSRTTTSGGATCPGVTSVVHAVQLVEPPPDYTPPKITARNVPTRLKVRVTADKGYEDTDPNKNHVMDPQTGERRLAKGLPAAVVLFEVTNGPPGGRFSWGLNTSAPNASDGLRAIGVTDEVGEAWVEITPETAGTYTITITNRGVVPEGTSLGPLFQPLTIQLEVQ